MNKLKNLIFFMMYITLNPRLIVIAIIYKLYIPVFVQYQWLKAYNIKTMIDVGAHKGKVAHSLRFLFPNSKIYAFEPDIDLHPNIRSRFTKNLVLEGKAISNKKGRKNFYKNHNPALSSLLHLLDKKAQQKLPTSRVDTATLDSYFEKIKLKTPIFLKIDTQGTEIEVLFGAKKLLKKVAIVHIETPFVKTYKNQELFSSIYDLLVKSGFVFVGEAQEAAFYPQFDLPTEANHIFLNPKLVSLRNNRKQ